MLFLDYNVFLFKHININVLFLLWMYKFTWFFIFIHFFIMYVRILYKNSQRFTVNVIYNYLYIILNELFVIIGRELIGLYMIWMKRL